MSIYRKVSVKERLPSRKGITFCFEKVNSVYDAPTAYYFSPDIGGFFNDSSDKEITHWLEKVDIEKVDIEKESCDNIIKVVEHYFEEKYDSSLVKHKTVFEFYTHLLQSNIIISEK